jgi:excisionase family DNA binding protein
LLLTFHFRTPDFIFGIRQAPDIHLFLFAVRQRAEHVQPQASPAAGRQPQEATMEQLTVSVSAAAKALGLGRTSIYALIKQNRIETIKIGRRTLVPTSSLRRLINHEEPN